MPGPTKVVVKGADRLNRTLIEAGRDMGDMKALHKAVGEVVADGAPPRLNSKTGALEATIRASGTKTAGVVRAGSGTVVYAGVQEFGWPARNIPGQGFLTGSLADNEENIVDLYQVEVDKILGEVRGQ